MRIKALSIGSPSFDISYSYGRIALSIAEEFKSRGVHVNYICSDRESKVPDTKYIFTPYSLLLGHPTNYSGYNGVSQIGKPIALTMFESTQLPKNWDRVLNQMAGVVVPSQGLVDIFQDCGVIKPIMCSPLGVSKAFTFEKRDLDGRFRFLLIGDRGDRKNWVGGGLAFAKAFGVDDMSVELVVKVHDDDEFDFNLIDPNVTLVKQDMTDEEMDALYKSCHALLFSSKGEGFGWPTLEMLRTGGVAICTEFLGLQWSRDYGAVIIPHDMKPAWENDVYIGCGEWGEPVEEDLVQALKDVRNSYGEYIEDAEDNSSRIEEDLTWDNLVGDLIEFWETL